LEEAAVSFEDLDEFPALPDLTIPFLGGIHCVLQARNVKDKVVDSFRLVHAVNECGTQLT
jgi:hypothetical protein